MGLRHRGLSGRCLGFRLLKDTIGRVEAGLDPGRDPNGFAEDEERVKTNTVSGFNYFERTLERYEQ